MPHCTPEQLALAALREPLPDTDAAHLAGCDRCRAEVASLQRGVDALAVPELAAPQGSVAPPPAVWAAIAGATGVSVVPRPELVAGGTAPARPAPLPAPAPPPPGPRSPSGGSVVRPNFSRLLLATAAALVVGIGVGAAAVALGTADGDEGLQVAAAALAPLDDRGATGEATVVERDDGSRVLELQLDAADVPDGYYEVWLLDEAVSRLVPVGVVQGGDEASLALPTGIDIGEYPVVDVSVEPLDGDPSHSGDSVARGVLES
ncbi:anti-sigma factor [Geodermatophilus marinus]|uniref:anti-sigma factor n=1 Tax=Geodermatophilus sp. LHW52908 TaxID=2303986 RepID=UPI000E3BE224|nr:anti-sigma factor [Geodermatophilus sp. LHW52908]RFU21448.1 ABC transporter substrate-binding protein [Geodermatophilus sp. LHW52908]